MLTIRQRKLGGPWHVRGTVRVGSAVHTVGEHSTGARDRATAEVYVQKLQADVSHSLLFKFGGDPTKAGRIAHAGTASFVYFLRSGDLIKIGVTKDVKRRRELIQNAHGQTITIVATVPGDRALEQFLHRLLKPYRAGGEWYCLPPEMVEHLPALRRADLKSRSSAGSTETALLNGSAENSVASNA